MDLDDFAVVLNSDSEKVLLQGLRLFARQIRREHGLVIAGVDVKVKEEGEGERPSKEAAAEDAGEEMTGMTSMEVDSDSAGSGSGNGSGSGSVGEGDEEEEKNDEEEEKPADGYREDLFRAAAEKGEAPGLLGEYLRGSPQLNDLLRLWDFDERKSSPLLSAAHTDALAAVLECLALVLRHLAAASTATGAGSAVARGEDIEAMGLGLCRRLTREKIDELHAQLSIHTTPPASSSNKKSKKKGAVKGMAGSALTGEEVAAATLRLLASVARFHRLAAKELFGMFNFSHKAFVKLVSRRGGGTSSAGPDIAGGREQGSAPENAAATAAAAAAEAATAGGGKKSKKKRKAAEMMAANAAALAAAAAAAADAAGHKEVSGADDTRHLSVDLLCAFMDSEDAALQMQMVTGTRGGGAFGLIFRGSLWRDPEATCIMVVETLHRRLLRNRRVSRRAKADFFSAGTIEHLRKVFDDASPRLYGALHDLMSDVMCDPITSPFLEAAATTAAPAGKADGRDRAVVTWQRPLLSGLACLGAHEDLGQRALLMSTLGTCPSLLGPYLRTFNAAMLEARPTYQLLQTYSLLAAVLREVPVARSFAAGEGGGGGLGVGVGVGDSTGQALFLSVIPTALSKKELTKGVLSGSPLLQAATMNLMASVLDRSCRVVRAATAGATAAAAAAGSSSSLPASSSISTAVAALLRQRMPEVQTLLGLRDKIGNGDSGGGGGGGSKGGGVDIPAAAVTVGGKLTERVVALKWRLLSLLDRYARVMPATVAAARFDFLKLLPLPGPQPPQLSPSTAGQGRDGSSSSSSANMHPLVQLATLRLLSREGVIAATGGSGGGQSSSSSSGWLTHRVTGTGGGSGGGSGSGGGAGYSGRSHAATTTTATRKHRAAENSPLGVVLRMALDSSLSPATRAAARALAVRALVSLGVVPAPPPHLRGGGVDEDEDEVATAAVAEGEAGVWVDALASTPGAAGALVSLAKIACDKGHGLMAAGIRAAQKGMEENRFLRTEIVGSGGSNGGDAGTGRDGDWEVEFSSLSVAAMASLAGMETDSLRTAAFGGPPVMASNPSSSTSTADKTGSAAFGVEGARLFTAALSRVIHLHEDPRPFAGLCLAFADAAAGGDRESTDGHAGGDGGGGDDHHGGDTRDNGGGETSGRDTGVSSPSIRACRGLAVAIARLFGGRPPVVGVGDRSAGNNAVHLLLKKRPPPRPPAMAASAARLAAVLADSPGLSVFELNRVRELLLASSAPAATATATATATAVAATMSTAGGGGGVRGGPDAAELEMLLSLPSLPLPRLIGDALTVLGDGGSSQTPAAGPSSLLPCSNRQVFDVLARRVSVGGETGAAAVRQIISRLDLALKGADALAPRRLASATEEVKDEEKALLLSKGIRLAARGCLDLVVSASSSPSSSSSSSTSQRAFNALADVFRRPFLLRLACPLATEATALTTAAGSSGATTDNGGGVRRRGGDEMDEGEDGEEDEEEEKEGDGSSQGWAASLRKIACTSLSALVVSAAAAAGTETIGSGTSGPAVVAEAAAPFLDRLCRGTADAVASGSPNLGWLSRALVACRGSCSSDALSVVLAALLSRLTITKGSGGNSNTNKGEKTPSHGGGSDAVARRLLEQLLAPPSRKTPEREGVSGNAGRALGRGGGASLVRGLGRESMAALMRLQVDSPSSDLGWLVYLALTGSSRESTFVGGGSKPMAAEAATGARAGPGPGDGADVGEAPARLLDGEAFFVHFFGRLTERGGNAIPTEPLLPRRTRPIVEGGGEDGDGPDARILEELVRCCPSHADRFAVAVVLILRDLPPLADEPDGCRRKSGGSGSGSGSDSNSGRVGSGGGGGGGGEKHKLSMAQASLGAAAAAVVTAERNTAAVETLLALRRPLEAFLRTGMLWSVPDCSSGLSSSDSSSLSSGARRKRTRFGGEKTAQSGHGGGGGGDGAGQENGGHGGDAMVSPAAKRRGDGIKTNNAAATATVAAACFELEEVLLPRCIVPLFEAAAGAKKSKGAMEEGQRDRRRRKGGGVGGVGGGSTQQEMKKGSLTCLEAVLEVSWRSRGGSGSATSAALAALRKSMAACEQSSKHPPPDAHAEALARAALAAWLSPSTTASAYHGAVDGPGASTRSNSHDDYGDTTVTCGSSSSLSSSSLLYSGSAGAARSVMVIRHVSPQHRLQEESARRDYLRHCLARSASAARAVGRAVRKATAAAAAAALDMGVSPGESAAKPPLPSAAEEAVPLALSDEENLCRFLLGEVARVVAGVEAEDVGGGGSGGAGAGDGAATASAAAFASPPRAERVLGLCRYPDTSTGAAASVGAVDAFLTAVLKHRLSDAASLRAVRAVASTLYHHQQQQSLSKPRRRRQVPKQPTATATEEGKGEREDGGSNDDGEDRGEEEPGVEEEEGEGKGGKDNEDEDGGEDEAAALQAKGVARASPVLPGWSAATMLERVVGHSGFFAVLAVEGPSRTELLKLLVLLMSAGGVEAVEGGGGGGGGLAPPAAVVAAHGLGVALVPPLLSVYRVSMSEDDQLIVRLLRLLQVSGVPLNPTKCRWGPAAAGSAEDAALATATLLPRAGCEWLVETFESRRLRASIEAFPIERELEPPPFVFEAAVRRRVAPKARPSTSAGGGVGKGGGGDGDMDGSVGPSGEGSQVNTDRDDGGSEESSSSSSGSSNGEDDGSGSDGGSSESSDDDGDGDEGGDDGGGGGGKKDGGLELAVTTARGRGGGAGGGAGGRGEVAESAAVAGQQADQVYDPCFVLPLLEWGLRSAGVKAQSVCESPLLGYVIMASSSLSLSTRASAFACLFHLLEALQEQEEKTARLWTAASGGSGGGGGGSGSSGGAAGFKARKAAEAAFRQRPQLTLLLRCLRDGIETPLERIPCAVAVVLAKASEALASSPGSEIYRVVNSFLLHRPYVRLDELPLFDTLFTGVQHGEGGRDGGMGGVGDALGATSTSDPAAATTKARAWMLRALRDGIRTSQDLELAAGKRAVPLLLAMADSPVGNGDAVIQGLILDVLCTVASLERSGARYLINSIGLVAWGRMVLGRSLLASLSTRVPNQRKASTTAGTGGAAKRQGAAATGALPVHLQAQLLSLLTRLLRSGRWLTPGPPSLLEEEFSLLVPEVVRCAVAAATAATAAVARGSSGETAGKGGVTRGGGDGGWRGGGAGHDGTAAVTHADVAVRSIAFLEELQMGNLPPTVKGSVENDDDDWAVLGDDGGGGPAAGRRGAMRLTLEEALHLFKAVTAMVESKAKASPSSDGPCLRARVAKLLASPGALEASIPVAAAAVALESGDVSGGSLSTSVRAAAHDEMRPERSTSPTRAPKRKADDRTRTAGLAPVAADDGGTTPASVADRVMLEEKDFDGEAIAATKSPIRKDRKKKNNKSTLA